MLVQKLKRIWLGTTFCLGMILIVLVPPFHSPDEFHHFYKAYHIADNHFTPDFNADSTELGGYIPRSLKTISAPFERLMHHKKRKITRDTILQFWDTPLEANNKQFVSFPNTARYAPTVYLPQVLSIKISKLLKVPPLWMTYIGRIITFLSWLGLILYALSWSPPEYQPFLMVLTALPASVALNSSLNVDVTSNGLLFIQLALFLHLRTQPFQQNWRQLWLYAFLVLITTWHKIIYFPMLGLLLLLDKRTFGGHFLKKYAFIGFHIILNIFLIFKWASYVHRLIYPFGDVTRHTYCDLRPEVDVNPDLQIQYIMTRYVQFFFELLNASFEQYGHTYKGYIATFGWELIRVHAIFVIPFWLIMLLWLGLEQMCSSKTEKWVFFVVSQAMTLLFLLSQYLHWDIVGGRITTWLASKYYYIMYALLLCILGGWARRWKWIQTKKVFIHKIFILNYAIIWIIFLLMIYQRYYTYTKFI